MNRESIELTVKNAINETLDESLQINNEDKLVDLGFDSMDAVCLIVILNDNLNTKLPSDSFDEIESVNDVIHSISEFLRSDADIKSS